jgi:hypothetical protein
MRDDGAWARGICSPAVGGVPGDAGHDGDRSSRRPRAGGTTVSTRPFPEGPIGSLAYFLPVIEEVRELRVSPDYFEYVHHKLARMGPAR